MDIKNTGSIDTRRDSVSSSRAAEGPARSSAAAPSAARSATRAEPSSEDRVTLTGAAQSLLEIRGEPDSGAPVDRARVEAIRASIADGSYQIRPERIAAALIRQDNRG